MHSAIAAFTLGIPSVILSWNEKVDQLMDVVGYPGRAIKKDQFDPVFIVDVIERSLEEGVDPEKVAAMKAKAKESVDDYIDLIYAACTAPRRESGRELPLPPLSSE